MRNSRHPSVLRWSLWLIALVQFILGAGFLAAPEGMATALGLSPPPSWVNWLFGMMAVRCLGYAYGLVMAARAPDRNMAWLQTMIGIQLIDWVVTIKYLLAGAVTLAQVTTAAFLPLVFVALLWWAWPQRAAGA